MPPYICYFCNKIFDQRAHLKNHFNKQKKCKFKKYDLNKKIKTEISHEDMILLFEIQDTPLTLSIVLRTTLSLPVLLTATQSLHNQDEPKCGSKIATQDVFKKTS